MVVNGQTATSAFHTVV